jgi:hypothetical protein
MEQAGSLSTGVLERNNKNMLDAMNVKPTWFAPSLFLASCYAQGPALRWQLGHIAGAQGNGWYFELVGGVTVLDSRLSRQIQVHGQHAPSPSIPTARAQLIVDDHIL